MPPHRDANRYLYGFDYSFCGHPYRRLLAFDSCSCILKRPVLKETSFSFYLCFRLLNLSLFVFVCLLMTGSEKSNPVLETFFKPFQKPQCVFTTRKQKGPAKNQVPTRPNTSKDSYLFSLSKRSCVLCRVPFFTFN